MITCVSGVTIRMPVISISEQGRATQGVKLIKVDEGDQIAAITQLDEMEEEILEAINPIAEELSTDFNIGESEENSTPDESAPEIPE